MEGGEGRGVRMEGRGGEGSEDGGRGVRMEGGEGSKGRGGEQG